MMYTKITLLPEIMVPGTVFGRERKCYALLWDCCELWVHCVCMMLYDCYHSICHDASIHSQTSVGTYVYTSCMICIIQVTCRFVAPRSLRYTVYLPVLEAGPRAWIVHTYWLRWTTKMKLVPEKSTDADNGLKDWKRCTEYLVYYTLFPFHHTYDSSTLCTGSIL